MDPKLFDALKKKMDEFLKETVDEDIHFFFGDHTPEILATASAAAWDGMELSYHCANSIGVHDTKEEYDSAAEFIKAARKAEIKERAERNDELAKEAQAA